MSFRNWRILAVVMLMWGGLVACNGETGRSRPATGRGAELAQRLLLIDTHVDIPYRLEEGMRDISGPVEEFNFDLPRARRGGLDVPFMSIYIPARHQRTGDAMAVADRLLDMMDGILSEHPDHFRKVISSEQVRALPAGIVGMAFGMENGAPLQDLAALQHFFERGIRYVTLTHGEDNHICDSSYDKARTWKGLSPYGRELVREMNRTGMMIDVSHVSDDTFYQVLEGTAAPVIASHSSCRHFTPGWERNMDDDMIRALAENGGVIQINFGSAFLTAEAQQQSNEFWTARSAYLDEHGYPEGGAEADAFRDSYWDSRTKLFATVADVADHIDHVVELVGIDHVGFGSDFDGVGDSLPVGLKSVADYPALLDELLRRGYTEDELEKVAGGNLLRVWSRVERLAEAG